MVNRTRYRNELGQIDGGTIPAMVERYRKRGKLGPISMNMFPASGLVSYYKLNKEYYVVADDFGSNVGIATDVSWTSGKINNAGSFNGHSSKIDMLTAALPSGRSVASTYNARFKKAIGTIDYVIMGRWESTGYYYIFLTNQIITTTSNDRAQQATTLPPRDTNWHMYTLVQDGTTNDTCGKFYIDGVYKVTTAFAISGLANGAATHNIGYADSSYAEGLIDEVGIRNRVLTQDEITTLYNNGAGLTYNP